MDQVEVDGLRIAYQRAGAGPPLILLHGYVGDGPTTWRRQLDGLCDQFTVLAWDAPGAGGSADPSEGFGLAGYADCLAGFLQRLGLEQPHVAGLSFGGILALELYRRHPGDADLGLCLCRVGRLAACRGRPAAAAASAGVGRAVARGVPGGAAADDVLPNYTAGGGGGVPGEHAGVPPGRLPGHGAGLRREPARGPCPYQRPDAAAVRRQGRASTPVRCRGPPRSDHRLDAGRPAGRWASVQHRSPRSVQQGSRELSPRQARLTIVSAAPRGSQAAKRPPASIGATA